MKVKCALIQLAFRKGVDNALTAAEGFIAEAAADGAQLILLPEMFCCPYSTKKFPEYAQPDDGEMCRRMSAAAAKAGVWLVAGTVPELVREEDGTEKIYNTAFVYRPDGREVCRHRKIHMFDVDVAGGVSMRESDTLAAGDSITMFDTPFGRVGVAVCYDLRFFEMFRLMQKAGCGIIAVPACFTAKTGAAHWEVLFRSRAIDCQCYLLGCAQTRNDSAPYVCHSHSIAVDPWGRVLADAGTDECIVYAELDTEVTEKVKAQLPVLKQLREDAYHL